MFFVIFYKICVVKGPSMNPTLQHGDTLILRKSHNPKRGQIIVFRDVTKDRILIKRVIAVSGDHLVIKNSKIYLNGKQLSEPYLKESHFSGDQNIKIPKGKLFVLGDNRNCSRDSRSFGCVKKEEMIGYMMFSWN